MRHAVKRSLYCIGQEHRDILRTEELMIVIQCCLRNYKARNMRDAVDAIVRKYKILVLTLIQKTEGSTELGYTPMFQLWRLTIHFIT